MALPLFKFEYLLSKPNIFGSYFCRYLQRIGKNEWPKKTCDIINPVSLVSGADFCYVPQVDLKLR